MGACLDSIRLQPGVEESSMGLPLAFLRLALPYKWHRQLLIPQVVAKGKLGSNLICGMQLFQLLGVSTSAKP